MPSTADREYICNGRTLRRIGDGHLFYVGEEIVTARGRKAIILDWGPYKLAQQGWVQLKARVVYKAHAQSIRCTLEAPEPHAIPEDEIWVTSAGERLHVKDMHPDHVRNALRVLLRKRRTQHLLTRKEAFKFVARSLLSAVQADPVVNLVKETVHDQNLVCL